MDINVTPGKYVVAVSGGVDSMALLHLLQQQPGVRLTVAHFDHGIRSDSAQDRLHVYQTAKAHGLPFVYAEGQLGPGASEAQARKARYEFLHQVLQASGARAIITAHHQDDVLETAIINLMRGTDRKGLSALQESSLLMRPLLPIPKQQIIDYAREQGLTWREDSTNQNEAFLRNYVRRRLLPRFSSEQRQQLWQLIQQARDLNNELDNLLANQLHLQPLSGRLDRGWFVLLPHNVAREVMAAWLRAKGLRDFDRRTLERLVIAAKTSPAGKQIDALHNLRLLIEQDNLALMGGER